MRGGEEATPGGFSRRTVAWLSGVAAGSFLLALVLRVYGPDLGRAPTAEPSTLSAGALGHRGAAELLRSLGLGVYPRQLRAGVGSGPETPLLVVEPDPARVRLDSTHRLAALREEARRRGAPLVLVAPKWTGEPWPEHPGWVRHLALRSEEEVLDVLGAVGEPSLGKLRLARTPLSGAVCEAAGGRRYRVELAPAQLLAEAPDLEAVVLCSGGMLVGRLEGEKGPPVLVVSDPDLLNNQGLGRADHAALVYDLLATRLGAQGVVFDETIHGFVRGGGLLAELLSFPLLPASVQVLLAIGLVVWAGAGRFGKPLASPARPLAGKTILIANTAALLTRGGDAAAGLERYLRQTLQAVAARLHLPPQLSAAETRRRLQQLSDARGLGIDLAAVAAQVRHLAAQPPRPAAAAVDLAGELHRWRREMIHGRR